MNGLDLLYIPLAIATAPLWATKKRAGWDERFGKLAALPSPTAGKKRILLHGVSVGEVNALRPLVPLLLEAHEVVVATTTDTGLARATALFGGKCPVVRYPLDFSWAVARFLDAVRPDVVGLVELEVWPNFIKACTRREIPVAVINGRLSERSFKGYRRIRFGIGPSFQRLAAAGVQDEAYRERFIAMGVPPERCTVTGSMKWDVVGGGVGSAPPGADQLAAELGIDRSRPLVVAGSTGPTPEGPEEALLHAACPPGVQLLCAPRKPERFDEAAAAMPGCVRRSARKPGMGTDRFLLDTIGELGKAYSLADVVVVGRSFGGLYGSDPMEPIGLGKATLIGPAVKDFETAVRAFEAAGGIVRTDRSRLGADLARLLGDAAERARVAAAGLACIEEHRGASRRHAAMLTNLAVASPGGP